MINKQPTNFTGVFSHHDETGELSHWLHNTWSFVFAFKYLTVFYQAFLPQQFMLKDSGFSFKLFKWYIDCFSFMCKLITKVGSNFLDRCKKIPWCREVMEWKTHISFQSIGIKNILYNFILIGIFFSEILKKERDKLFLGELTNVHPWAAVFWQIPTTWDQQNVK